MKFTDKLISNMKPTDKQYIVREGKGFGIRILPSGFRTWLFIYTLAGKRRQMNLGDYPDIPLIKARERHIDALQALKDGKDPQEVGFEWHRNPQRDREEHARLQEEDRRNPTVDRLAKEYLEKHAKPKKRNWAEDERMINVHLLPAWGGRKAAGIKKRDVVLLLEDVMERGPAMANAVFKLVRKMFAFAVERDILEHTPCMGLKEPAATKSRERSLSEEEIRNLWNGLDHAGMSYDSKQALKLILVTAQRPGEVIGMHSREIDDRWWTIPAERAKNKQPHRVYLTDIALEIIGKAEGYIFPTPVDRTRLNKPGRGHIDKNVLSSAVRKNLKGYTRLRPARHPNAGKVAKIGKVREERKLVIDHFTPHDLRRTAATFLSEIGFMDEVIDSVLGHKKQGIIKVYNRNRYDKEKQQALEAWERRLRGILDGKQKASVTPISVGRKTGNG